MKRKAITLVMLLLCLIFMAACSDQNDSDAAVNSGLTIDVSDLSSDISYFDYDADGIAMQLIARVDDAGTPKLSYNTCQSCAGSPYAYFEVVSGALVCRNCGNRFGFDTIGETRNGGCMPMAVTDYTVEDGKVIVSAETLNGMKNAFKNWKKGL